MVASFCPWGLMLVLCAAVLALLAFLAWEAVKAFRSSRMRIAATFFFAAAILYGGGKRKSPDLDFAPFRGPARVLRSDAGSGFQNWGVHGAWRKSAWFQVDDDWVFPDGTNRLHGVEVLSQGLVWRTPFDTNPVAEVGVPLAVVPGLTQFGAEHTPSGSYRFSWTDAAAWRDTNSLVTASVELVRNGDVAVETNGVVTFLPRELPYPHDGFGQDSEWVSANFTNAEEVLSAGYAQWVDAQVGHGLTNGLYKLTATLLEDPPETTWLNVGGSSVAVTNAGEFVFLLEKGVRYPITVFPRDATNFLYDACDDIAPQMRGAPSPSRRAMRATRGSAGDSTYDVRVSSHVDQSGIDLVPPTEEESGHVTACPILTISPETVYNPQYPLLFAAAVLDFNFNRNYSYVWTYSDGSASGDKTEFGESFMLQNENIRSVGLTVTCGDIEIHGGIIVERCYRESSITLEGGSLMVTEEAYTNAPGEVVAASSSELGLAASWGLAKSGTLRLESSCPTVVSVSEKVGGVSSPVPLPFEWHAMENNYGQRELFVSVDDKSATGEIGSITFTFVSDDGIENLHHATVLRAVKLRVEADAQWPSNRTRHVFGPQETFKIRQTPSGFFTFSPGSQGGATVTNGTTVVAPDNAKTFTVTASSDYGSVTLPFGTIAPTDMKGGNPRNWEDFEWHAFVGKPLAYDEAGVVMHIDTWLEPLYVSFKHLRLYEGYAPTCNRRGWYLDLEEFPEEMLCHNAETGAGSGTYGGSFGIAEVGNMSENGDFVGSWIGSRLAYTNGAYQLAIPLKWFVEGGATTNTLPINLMSVWVYSNGTMRVQKNGVTWERPLGGTGHSVSE